MTWTVTTRYKYDLTRVWCGSCDLDLIGVDVRLVALQHTKRSGHATRVHRETLEKIEPDKEETATNG